jgi:GTP-binding protein
MLEVVNQNPPPAIKGKWIKIKFITQIPTYTPAFAFFCNLPQYVKEPYKRFLENKLREHWDFKGVPIQIFMRKK